LPLFFSIYAEAESLMLQQ